MYTAHPVAFRLRCNSAVALDCCGRGFESHSEHGSSSVVYNVYCESSGLSGELISLIRGVLPVCVCVCVCITECNLETSTMTWQRFWLECCTREQKKHICKKRLLLLMLFVKGTNQKEGYNTFKRSARLHYRRVRR
jgi:hypothetical protein